MKLFETSEDMKKTFDKWNKTTYSEALEKIIQEEQNSEEINALARTILKRQNLCDKTMNGNSTRNLKLFECERLKIKYTQVIDNLEKSDKDWNLANIIMDIAKHVLNNKEYYEKKAKQKQMSINRMAWLMCGRALRALAPIIREKQLKNEMAIVFPKSILEQNSKLDIVEHCDLKMTIDDVPYYFWSFMDTPKSITHFCSKFSNHRAGKINNGYHVLCPHEEIYAYNYLGWTLYSHDYIQNVKNLINSNTTSSYESVIGEAMISRTLKGRPILVLKSVLDQAV